MCVVTRIPRTGFDRLVIGGDQHGHVPSPRKLAREICGDRCGDAASGDMVIDEHRDRVARGVAFEDLAACTAVPRAAESLGQGLGA